jgi:molecular chaperone DnaK
MENRKTKTDEQSFRPIVGIDLGTTNSAAAYIHNGKPEMINGSDGEEIIPSVVFIDTNKKVVVGRDARSALVAMPDRTKAAVKREMGEKEPIQLAGESYLPEEISAFVLKEIKQSVDELFGGGEKEAVITVPAYFTDEQRRATKKAGELAGFVVERIINEPTAAAMAFGLKHLKEDRHVLVYDLGGGTFDVSVVEMIDGIIEVKASAGNNRLGGEDFDWLLVDWLAEAMLSDHDADPREDVRAKALLKEEAESIKKQLSDGEQADISLPVVMMKDDQPLGLHQSITREQFVALVDELLLETIGCVTQVLADAGLDREDIDEILFVGGSTKIPRVSELIEDYFNKAPRTDVNPDEAVALGAGVQAGLKSGALADSGLIVTDVAPFSMGISVLKESLGLRGRPGGFHAVIPRNTTVPVTRTETFQTTSDKQTDVSVEIYQGEAEWVKDNHFLDKFLLGGLPEARAGEEAVQVTFRYNLNGILEVTAKSVSTEKTMTVTVQDALNRQTEEAFEKSLEKVKALYEGADDSPEEEELYERDLLDLLEEDDETNEGQTLEELRKEAEHWRHSCEASLSEVSKPAQKRLKKMIAVLDQAFEANGYDQLNDAVDQATDLMINLDLD